MTVRNRSTRNGLELFQRRGLAETGKFKIGVVFIFCILGSAIFVVCAFLARAQGERKVALAKQTILLAEDNPADVYLIREALREHGVDCTIREASDGGEVIQILDRAKDAGTAEDVDLIVLDLNLPRHDGIEILQHLRDSPSFSHVPVVVLTSSDSPRDRMVANQLGAKCYLRKPSSLTEFLNLGAVFKDLLSQSKTQAAEG